MRTFNTRIIISRSVSFPHAVPSRRIPAAIRIKIIRAHDTLLERDALKKKKKSSRQRGRQIKMRVGRSIVENRLELADT